MPEATATESEITTALLGDDQDLSVYIAEAVSQIYKGTISPKNL